MHTAVFAMVSGFVDDALRITVTHVKSQFLANIVNSGSVRLVTLSRFETLPLLINLPTYTYSLASAHQCRISVFCVMSGNVET